MKVKTIALLLPIFLIWLFLFPVYRARVPAFGCFDDCFNYMGGYFVNSGKRLYSEIFYNHQPIMAYISALIARLGHPETIYALVLQHRLFVIVWSVTWNIFLTLRFGWPGLGFSFLYEATKGYVFGDRFLAEALIVYPVAYLVSLVDRNISAREKRLVSVLVWFITFSREPYAPLGLLLLFLTKGNINMFLGLSLVTVLLHPSGDYFFNVVTVNTTLASSMNLLQSFIYPISIFFGGTWNLFRYIEVGLIVLFWIGMLPDSRNWKTKIPAIVLLGLANIRPVAPGTIYYEAFVHAVAYGVLIMLVVQNSRKFVWVGFGFLVFLATLHPTSYLYDRVDRVSEFTQNYSIYYVTGSVVRMLSQPSDTLFVDGVDDLIYWEAKRFSKYPYSWYTSFMHEFPVYTRARQNMLKTNPPDFYYGSCAGERLASVVPDDVMAQYRRFYWQEKPTCLFVHKTKLEKIPAKNLLELARQFEYSVR